MENQLNTQLPDQTDTYNIGTESAPLVSPDQITMFEPSVEPTSFDIPHQPTVVETASDTTETAHDEGGVSNATKTKVLAALAVVAVAGYIAYWVQEPLQIKADVISPDSAMADTSSDVAAADAAAPADVATMATGTSKNVDVSLFGFEPAVLKIDKGTTVIWTNTSTEDQTIIGSSKNADSFTSTVLKSGDTFSHQFDKDGVYEYYSTYNPALKANLTVGLGNAIDTTTELKPAADTKAPETISPDVTTPIDTTSAKDEASASLESAVIDAVNADLSTSDLTAANLEDAVNSENLKPAADTNPKNLTKTGPEDLVYIGALMVIAYFNRKKLLAIFN